MMQRLLPALLAAAFALPAGAAEPQVVRVHLLTQAPKVDGAAGEWGKDGWVKVPIKPAVDRNDRAKLGLTGEDRNYTGSIEVQIKAGVNGGRLYLVARWPDEAADTQYKGWEWSGGRYVESKQREDMFAVRFHLNGDFDRSMLSDKQYGVDVWLWSAARTNPQGLAEDMQHRISTREIENAAEYAVPAIGVVYIKKERDAGTPLYKMLRAPKEKGADHLPSFESGTAAGGSIADVAARGQWKGGFWTLELSRAMNAGHSDDVEFKAGQRQFGQIAVFNHSSDEHKSISEPLLFDFGGIR